MNRVKHVIALFLAAVFLAGAGGGQGAGEKKKPAGLPQKLAKSKQPVQIEAANLVVFRKEGKIIFSGNVLLKRAPTTIRCKKLIAYYREKDASVKTAICYGNVRVVHKDTFARCKKATYDNIKRVIIMEGSPVIYQEKQIFRGDVLKYYLDDERITGTNVRYQRNPSPPPVTPKNP